MSKEKSVFKQPEVTVVLFGDDDRIMCGLSNGGDYSDSETWYPL